MAILSKEQRNQLSRVVLEARAVAEAAATKALRSLAVDEADPPSHLSPENRTLRRALRAQARQLGDKEDPRKKGSYNLYHLTEKIAYDQWHRMLFARFLAESDLLIAPEHGVPVSLQECRELAPELNLRDEWDVAVRFAAKSLPQIFRPDDPAGKIDLAPEDRASLRDLVVGLPRDTFLADDSLGWSYQFWQTERKKQVNEAGNKIGADELPAVTQLFTEDYMVDFLLDNTLGAYHAGKVLSANSTLAENAQSEDELRQGVSLPGCPWKYLRFIKGNDSKWTPAAGIFDGWPKMAKELKCLDPCMGSGHFVVAMFERLVALLTAEEKLDEAAAVATVIGDNLFGLEIDPRCTQIAAFNLALAAWRRVGYCALPAMNLACSGLAPNAKKDEWTKLAGADSNLLFPMGALYELFQKAPVLGSLINPRQDRAVTYGTTLHELQPLLDLAMMREREDDTHELAVTARGLVKAAEILTGQFTLVATNVPFLGGYKQCEMLADYLETAYRKAGGNLANAFLMRIGSFVGNGHTLALVTPQDWMLLGRYTKLREALLPVLTARALAFLGPHAFETIKGEVVTTGLSVWDNTAFSGSVHSNILAMDAQRLATPVEKAAALATECLVLRQQSEWLVNPNKRITVESVSSTAYLSAHTKPWQGVKTSDDDRFVCCFWELDRVTPEWRFYIRSLSDGEFSGREHVLLWEDGTGQLRQLNASQSRDRKRDLQGAPAWGQLGIAINTAGRTISGFFLGEAFASEVVVLTGKQAVLAPVLAFTRSPSFAEAIRKLDKRVSITTSTFSQVPFDLAHWQKVAAENYPHGLPKPFSSDPTQWLFNGHPKGSDQPLQVAVARLLGYQWPRQTGSSFPDCPALGPDGVEKLADEDGIVCINPIKGEQPAAERLRTLLAAAFGDEWAPGKQNELLEQVGFAGKTPEDWLRNGFFEQHCQLFHQRPFIWHIWDGRRDGFSTLVNYHKLNRGNLEKLTYTFLGDWIGRQKLANDAGEEGSDARLQAAQELKTKLEKIIDGEAPFDIFVRWKPIEKQPIGWEPDLNDGVRLNIRPFVEAGVLRKDPKINWKKDRGKDVASAPWYKVFKGERINDHHLKLEEKRKARGKS